MLAVNENDEVIGKVMPRASHSDMKRYTIAPGALIGKGPGNFLMIPSLNANEQPLWIPANCEVQNAKPRLELMLVNSTETAGHEFALEEEPLPEIPQSHVVTK